MIRVSSLFTFFIAMALAGCSPNPESPSDRERATPLFHAQDNPQLLSAWGQLDRDGTILRPANSVVPYTLATPLFSDYAGKLRTIWLTQEADSDTGTHQALYRDNDILAFPIGTVITKTFYYKAGRRGQIKPVSQAHANRQQLGLDLSKHRLIETRLLVRRASGWEPISYIWDDDQRDAQLKRTGAIKPLTLTKDDGTAHDFVYSVPNINQCAGCHIPNATEKHIRPLGPKGRNLNIDNTYKDGIQNQLDHLVEVGFLAPLTQAPSATPVWSDPSATIAARARAYLDVNCAHCHNPVGPADTSGLHLNLENDSLPHLGICKNAVAAGAGTGGRRVDIAPGAPDASILVHRMETRDPAAMMPELGRSLAHDEGISLIRQWIEEMSIRCENTRI